MRSTLIVVSLATLFALPGVARADCLSALRVGVDEVEKERAVSDSTLTVIGAACEGEPAAALVNELVRLGRCDTAAQLGRANAAGGAEALDAAIESADRCLASTVADKLDDLSAAFDELEDMDAEDISNLGALGDSMGESGGVVGLGSRGSGYGGGSELFGGVGGSPSADAPRRGARVQAADGYGGSARTRAPRAATGAGRYVASATGKSSNRQAPITEGAAVAWSRLDIAVWFDFDSAGLRPEALETLAVLARRVESMRPGTVLEIVGHTDSRGSWGYNLDLSARRAESVRSALTLAGVSGSRMGTRAMGESDPVRSNRSWYGRAQNRRVEFRFLQPVTRLTR